jgi:hypothetical protein
VVVIGGGRWWEMVAVGTGKLIVKNKLKADRDVC